MTRINRTFIFALIFIAQVIFSASAFAIVPPSDEEALLLRDAPDLQERIDRANSLLEPLINPETIDPIAATVTFSSDIESCFEMTESDDGFRSGHDLNGDGIIDERDFVELAFIRSNEVGRSACKSPTHGEARCIVLLIKFPDVEPSPSHHSDYWQEMFFGESYYTTRSYYEQVSDELLDMGGDVLVNPEEPDGYWVASGLKASYDWDQGDLLGEILAMADEYYDFSEYDADNNGEADGVFFIYAGDVTGWGNFYWGWATYGDYIIDGVRVGPLMFVGEHLMTYRVAAHEYGHMMGLPDYYDYTYTSAGVGIWCMMGKGEAGMSARSRIKLGWVEPVTLGMDMYDVEFTPRSEHGDIYRLWHQGETGPEYFLVEMVTPTAYDYQLPGSGLMIWHVDDTISNNNNWQHKLLDVEEADGLDHLDKLTNWGDSTDPYFEGNNTTFNSASYPNSKAYSGADTDVQVLNISAIGSTMTADLLVGIPGNLEVNETEPNNFWNDSGVKNVPAPNGLPDGKVDIYT
ncbi:MAG TPA: M6 family metalloprotease domain-containing protein, partial [Firmicutes bacterium]|nr:M6 family metalloprotease domain-containing protein [Bacillota bacterium]